MEIKSVHCTHQHFDAFLDDKFSNQTSQATRPSTCGEIFTQVMINFAVKLPCLDGAGPIWKISILLVEFEFVLPAATWSPFHPNDGPG